MLATAVSFARHHQSALCIIGAFLVVAAHTTHLVDGTALVFVALASLFLIGSVFAAVEHAEVISLRIGEPFGSVLLAGAVTVIEVALIVSIMMSASVDGSEIARDTVFATLMIVLNGVVGLCLLTGGLLHREQEFHASGAAAALGVLGTLATLTLILPNFTLATPGPSYSTMQLGFVAIVSATLYGLFLFVQTVRHRNYFTDIVAAEPHEKPSGRQALTSLGLLFLALLMVILLAEDLTPVVSDAVLSAGLNSELIGVLIAAVVLLPEGTTAFRAARANRIQTSLNLALGSALASIGLSIPTVAIVSILLDRPITLGLESDHIVQIVLTLFIGTITLATGRTTILQGGVHLVIFFVFLLMSAAP